MQPVSEVLVLRGVQIYSQSNGKLWRLLNTGSGQTRWRAGVPIGRLVGSPLLQSWEPRECQGVGGEAVP